MAALTAGGAALLSLIIAAIGTGTSAAVDASQTEATNAANMNIYSQNRGDTLRQQSIQNRFANEQLGLQREQFKASEKVSNYAFLKDQVAGTLNLLNNNNTLTDRLLQKWS